MDGQARALTQALRAMTSADAAAWLIRTYPPGSEDWAMALTLIPHRSWKPAEQYELARHYMVGRRVASRSGYDAFAKVMPVWRILQVIEPPAGRWDREFFDYHLVPSLKDAARSRRDLDALATYLKGVSG